jgi:excisionase family DNA binding protein
MKTKQRMGLRDYGTADNGLGGRDCRPETGDRRPGTMDYGTRDNGPRTTDYRTRDYRAAGTRSTNHGTAEEHADGRVLVTTQGLAVALGVSLRTVERMLHDEEIVPVRLRGAVRFHVPDVLQGLVESGGSRKNGRRAGGKERGTGDRRPLTTDYRPQTTDYRLRPGAMVDSR